MSDQPLTMDAEEILAFSIGYIESLLDQLDDLEKPTIAYVLQSYRDTLNKVIVEEGKTDGQQ